MSAYCRPSMLLLLVPLISIGTLRGEEEKGEPKQVLRNYLKAFAEADFASMGKYYAAEVTVIRGSTLLDKKYGSLGENGGREKDRKVKQADLLKAYEHAVQALGGRDHWVKRGKGLKDVEIEVATVKAMQSKSKRAQETFKAIDAKPDDVVATVGKQDAMTFILRKVQEVKEKGSKDKERSDKGARWQIVAEHWD